MKQLLLIGIGCGAGIGLMLLFKHYGSDHMLTESDPVIQRSQSASVEHKDHVHEHSTWHGHTHHIEQYPISDMHKVDDVNLAIRMENVSEEDLKLVNKEAFRGVTDDPAVMLIMTTCRPPSAGTVTQTAIGYKLSYNSIVFEASRIGATRSVSNDGTIAFDAITQKDGNYIKEIDATNGGVAVMGDPGEIWIADSSGKAEKLSQDDIHGKNPIISPDGRYVAYVAQYVSNNALHAKFLMITDRFTKKSVSYSGRRNEATYEIAPIDWVDGGNILRVLEDWGETGGHMLLKQVNFNSK